ncbi:hypothetical protein G6F52_007425 [Rhizopus delemar]|nr:hypothetical protein G6F52_007425 [Rhizopus delemar]
MVIEISGRRKGLNSPEEWYELMKQHAYQRHDSDLRSPCPMLNTLANHGFLPRDGRNVTPSDFFDALMLLRVPPTFTAAFLAYVYVGYKEANPTKSFVSQFGFTPTLHLDRLTVYNMVEHDVSLTRQDAALPPYDTTYPIPHYVERMVRLAELNNTDPAVFTRKNEHDARRLRWLESSRNNKFLRLSLMHQFASGVECSLLLDIIGRDGQLKTDHLVSFLLHEKFPEDWYPRTTTYSITEQMTKPVHCWRGLYSSEVTLDVLNEL